MKKWARWTVGIVLGFALLITFLWQEENRRGKRIWEETCARLRAAGEPVELADIIPPMIPDEENVAMAPIFAEVFANKETARLARMFKDFTGKPYDDRGILMPQPKVKPLAPDDMSYVVEWRDYLRACFPANMPNAAMEPAEEILHYLEPWQRELTELQIALERPRCRWPLHYGTTEPVPMVTPLLGIGNVTRPRLIALAAKGDSDGYVDGVITQLRVGRLMSGDHMFLMGLALNMGADTLTLRSLQNCLPVLHLEGRHLMDLQRQLALVQMAAVKKAYRDDLVYSAHVARHFTMEQLKQTLQFTGASPFHRWPEPFARVADKAYPTLMIWRPEGWSLADAATNAQVMHDEVLPCIDEVAGTILHSRMARLDAAEKKHAESARLLSVNNAGSFQTTSSMMMAAARHQALTREVLLWCAIERFRLKHGSPPEKLDALVPEFLDKIPCDPVNGLELRYVRKGEQDYLLYSIGWNDKDDGGVEMKRRDLGDWVWASDPKLIVNPDEEKQLAEGKILKDFPLRTPKKPSEKPMTPSGVAK
jgi:hypothetical protein